MGIGFRLDWGIRYNLRLKSGSVADVSMGQAMRLAWDDKADRIYRMATG
jgi:hypothetical protein